MGVGSINYFEPFEKYRPLVGDIEKVEIVRFKGPHIFIKEIEKRDGKFFMRMKRRTIL